MSKSSNLIDNRERKQNKNKLLWRNFGNYGKKSWISGSTLISIGSSFPFISFEALFSIDKRRYYELLRELLFLAIFYAALPNCCVCACRFSVSTYRIPLILARLLEIYTPLWQSAMTNWPNTKQFQLMLKLMQNRVQNWSKITATLNLTFRIKYKSLEITEGPTACAENQGTTITSQFFNYRDVLLHMTNFISAVKILSQTNNDSTVEF